MQKSQRNHLNQQFNDKDKKLTKEAIAEATMDSPQINMFNKDEYSIYRDSKKRMYAMKDGEKFI